MKFPARILGTLFAFLLIVFVTKVSFAQVPTTPVIPQQNVLQNQYATPNTNPEVPKNLHTWTQTVMLEVMSAMTCQLAGIDPMSPTGQCLGLDQKTGKIGYVAGNGGVPAFLGKMISSLYIPPIQTGQYVQYLSQNFGIANPSYAQTTGVGFNQLSPLINLWTKFRDMSYLLFIFLFVIVGIAIMLRVRIDPRTVMTIQNQIPKLIIGIVLVTLSFPIAGFMVDMMWVSTYTIVRVIGADDLASFSEDINKAPPLFVNDYFEGDDENGGLHHIGSEVSDGVVQTIQDLFADKVPPNADVEDSNLDAPPGDCSFWIFCGLSDAVANTVGGVAQLFFVVAGSVGNALGAIVSAILSQIIGLLAFLIIVIAIIYSLFKLWFALLKAYIMILMDVIFAPFWIMGGLLPGTNSLGFINWLRHLAGNLAVFPAVIALFAIGKIFIDSASSNTTAGQMFIPPLIGNVAGDEGLSVLSSLIALGIILASPEVVATVKKAFKGQGGGGAGGGGFMGGAAIGGAIGLGGSLVANPLKRVKNATFGMDQRTGQAKFGSAFLGRKFGAVGQAFTGGGTQGTSQWVRNPGTFRGAGGAIGKAGGAIVRGVGAIPVVGKVAGRVATSIKGAPQKINRAVPHYYTQAELDAQAQAAAKGPAGPPAPPAGPTGPAAPPAPPAPPAGPKIIIPPARRTRP